MERPQSRSFLVGQNQGLGGRVTTGNSPARSFPGAASSQPPHMSISQSISRTTSFRVYERRYLRTGRQTSDLRAPSAIAQDRGVDQFGDFAGQRSERQQLAVKRVHPRRERNT